MKKFICPLAVTAICLTGSQAFAQTPPPATTESSRLQEMFTKQKIRSKITDKIIVQDEAQQQDLGNAAEIKLQLKSVTIEGNKTFSNEELNSLYADKLGQQVTLADVYAIRDAITKKYRENGYIISRAILPQQEFDATGANVKIVIVEGYVNNVTIQGENKGSQYITNSYIEKLKQPGALNSKTLEKYLLMLNDLPGTNATATIRPATSGVGASDVIITIEHDYVDGIISVDNSGSKYIGPLLGSAELNLNSALGLSEKITARIISDLTSDNELKFGNVEYYQPLGAYGTVARLGYGRTRTQPGSTLEPLDIQGDTDVYSAELTQQIVRSRKNNISARLGFQAKETDTDSGTLDIYEDKLRVFAIGATFDHADEHGGVNLIDVSVNQGADIAGATNANSQKSRANGDAVFTRYNFEASRNQKLPGAFSILTAMAGQYANEGLLASEEFGIGGREFGRGYNFSEITGDSGIAAKVELQFGLSTGIEYISDVQLYTFYDLGKVWQQEWWIAGEDKDDYLSSAGIGTKFNIANSVASYVEVAKPLTRERAADQDKDWQFNFGLGFIF